MSTSLILKEDTLYEYLKKDGVNLKCTLETLNSTESFWVWVHTEEVTRMLDGKPFKGMINNILVRTLDGVIDYGAVIQFKTDTDSIIPVVDLNWLSKASKKYTYELLSAKPSTVEDYKRRVKVDTFKVIYYVLKQQQQRKNK